MFMRVNVRAANICVSFFSVQFEVHAHCDSTIAAALLLALTREFVVIFKRRKSERKKDHEGEQNKLKQNTRKNAVCINIYFICNGLV